MGTCINNDFLAASTVAAKDLCAAQVKQVSLEAKANGRLVQARLRHGADLAEDRKVEAHVWWQFMAVPSMTAATAAQIDDTTAIKVSRWISGKPESGICH